MIKKTVGAVFSKESSEAQSFLYHLQKELGFLDPEDWYLLETKKIPRGRYSTFQSLLSSADRSPSKLLRNLYPSYEFKDWRFEKMTLRIPLEYWNTEKNQKEFLDWLGIQLGFKEKKDWYQITHNNILEHKGGVLLSKYGNSAIKLLMNAYPDHRWWIWNFERVPIPDQELKDNQRKYMEWIGSQFGFKKMEDWYNITEEDFKNAEGEKLLSQYGRSISRLISSTYPDHKWSVKNFILRNGSKRRDFWQLFVPKGSDSLILLDRAQRIEIVNWVSKEVKVVNLEDWYRVSWAQLYEKIPPRFFERYQLEQVLKEAYPFHPWDQSKLQPFKVSDRIIENTKEFFDVKKNLGFKSLDDFYSMTKEDIVRFGVREYIERFHAGSLIAALQSSYPGHNWLPWKFEQPVPDGFWERAENKRAFMDSLGEYLGFKRMEDWYKISVKSIKENGGSTLLEKYTVSKLVMSTYPNHAWSPEKFHKQKQFMDWLGLKLGYNQMEDWYQICRGDIESRHGRVFLELNRGSPYKLVMSTYPDHKWSIWRFKGISWHLIEPEFWKDKENQRDFMEWLGLQLGVKIMEDWYSITSEMIKVNHGGPLLKSYDGLSSTLIISVYPEHCWTLQKFSKR